MSDLRGRASRDLNRAGFDNPQRRRWTRHGSTKHLFHDDKVEAAVCYTLDEQGDRMAWYANDSYLKNEPRTKEPRTK